MGSELVREKEPAGYTGPGLDVHGERAAAQHTNSEEAIVAGYD